MSKKDASAQYLSQYAEAEVGSLAQLHALEAREFALLIPAYDEDPDFIQRLMDHPQAARCTLILVVNSPDTSQTLADANSRLLEWLHSKSEVLCSNSNLSCLKLSALQILLVDRSSTGLAIPAKQGVGLARKIAADIALSLIQSKKVLCEWIHSSDADAYLPVNYFDAQAAIDSSCVSAICFDFQHRCDNSELGQATAIYEACMRYFTDSLKQAGSSYTYHALGSCLAVHAQAYAKVRGFPKRAGGEDFYLLNKLAKIGEIAQINNVVVGLSARNSSRVPFGTGPAVAKIIAQFEEGITPRYYDPRVFKCLTEVLNSIEFLWEQRYDTALALSCFQDETASALQEAKLETFLEKRRQQDKNLQSFKQSFENWFDAFQTLKFLHRIQAKQYPAITIDKIPLQGSPSSSILSLRTAIDGNSV